MVQRDYFSMTLNERLFVAGRLEEFNAAIQRGDRASAVEILAAAGVEWPDAVFTQSLETAKDKRPTRLFWPLLLLIAALVGFWLYSLNNGPVLSCPDGHCPDAGTPEYITGVTTRNEAAPIAAIVGSVSVVFIGTAIRVLGNWLRRRLS
ncbi:hypothetical protein [Sphingobium ummariense]